MDFITVADLVEQRSRWSLKRAESMLLTHLNSYVNRPLLKHDLIETYIWLSHIKYIRRNYGRALQHILTNLEILEFLPDDTEGLVRAKLQASHLCIKLKKFKEAQLFVIEANALAGGMCGKAFREEVKSISEKLFNELESEHRDLNR